MSVLSLVNTNTMAPFIAPVGLDYIATFARRSGLKTDIIDLCLAGEAEGVLEDYFSANKPLLVGLSFRNVDDCFWPSAGWFVPQLAETVNRIRGLTDAPIVIGGVGFSIFAEEIVRYTGADFGICGDGEEATVALVKELGSGRRFEGLAGLIRRSDGRIRRNGAVWPDVISIPTSRDAVDNKTYFEKGGQVGLETKRGCNRDCIYCADRFAKGTRMRLRRPAEAADEAESLLGQGIDCLHLCDSEFNIPREHAMAVCEEFIGRSLGKRLRWYCYMAVVPFDDELARAMRLAGCVGIDFTGDSACPAMLKTYCQRHCAEDLANAVRLCRENGIKVMVDLLLGGPGETVESAAETIDFMKAIGPDCVGAALGVRIYPGTRMAQIVAEEGPAERNPSIRRRYDGPVDYFKPTFYISARLGSRPAEVICELIGGDKRFFEPMREQGGTGTAATDHNYNDNTRLVEAIKNGARGAYWDILRGLKG